MRPGCETRSWNWPPPGALDRQATELNTIRIGAKSMGPGQPAFLIAELSANHNGSLERALAMFARRRLARTRKISHIRPILVRSDPIGLWAHQLSRAISRCHVAMGETAIFHFSRRSSWRWPPRSTPLSWTFRRRHDAAGAPQRQPPSRLAPKSPSAPISGEAAAASFCSRATRWRTCGIERRRTSARRAPRGPRITLPRRIQGYGSN